MMLGSVFDNMVKARAMETALTTDALREYFSGICKSGCDRIPVKVRNLPVPFYLAGLNKSHVFLIHAETCMVSQFSFEELEPIPLRDIEDIQKLVIAWLDSAECAASRSLVDRAKAVRDMGMKLPVTLAWPDKQTRQGYLNDQSNILGGPSSAWICAVETTEGQGVVFRYGITRLERAMHDGKNLRIAVKPGTPL